MPRFVPVVDTEKPRCEQQASESEFFKHRQWETPHAILGGAAKYDRVNSAPVEHVSVYRKSNTMIKEERGLWVKKKQSNTDINKQCNFKGNNDPYDYKSSSKRKSRQAYHSQDDADSENHDKQRSHSRSSSRHRKKIKSKRKARKRNCSSSEDKYKLNDKQETIKTQIPGTKATTKPRLCEETAFQNSTIDVSTPIAIDPKKIEIMEEKKMMVLMGLPTGFSGK